MSFKKGDPSWLTSFDLKKKESKMKRQIQFKPREVFCLPAEGLTCCKHLVHRDIIVVITRIILSVVSASSLSPLAIWLWIIPKFISLVPISLSSKFVYQTVYMTSPCTCLKKCLMLSLTQSDMGFSSPLLPLLEPLLFILLVIIFPEIFNEHLLCTDHWYKHCRYSSSLHRQKPVPSWSLFTDAGNRKMGKCM